MKRRTIPIYNLDVHFTDSELDAESFLRRHGEAEFEPSECKGMAHGWRDAADEGWLVVGVFDGDLGTVAHEAVHAAGNILEVCSIKTTPDADEPLAMLTAWFVKTMVGLFPGAFEA